jgi:ABC-2 type transport system ATP-binding protein
MFGVFLFLTYYLQESLDYTPVKTGLAFLPMVGALMVAAQITSNTLTKRYGDKTVVDRLSFTVKPGEVTGFLGPNGAGKSTTMRMIIGLDFPTGGSVTVNGRPYARHSAPLHEVGTLLEAKSVHPGRTAFNHLMALAYTHGIPRRRVDQVIELAGLGAVAGWVALALAGAAFRLVRTDA